MGCVCEILAYSMSLCVRVFVESIFECVVVAAANIIIIAMFYYAVTHKYCAPFLYGNGHRFAR